MTSQIQSIKEFDCKGLEILFDIWQECQLKAGKKLYMWYTLSSNIRFTICQNVKQVHLSNPKCLSHIH